MAEYTAKFLSRFWSKVNKRGLDDCWNWTAASVRGYGSIYFEHRIFRAHRVAYQIENGPFPDELHVLHSCDNTKCCNPKHLFLGTQADNNLDKERKGRSNRPTGERHWKCKLTDADVAEIRRLSALGVSRCSLSETFHVSLHHISDLVNHKCR